MCSDVIMDWIPSFLKTNPWKKERLEFTKLKIKSHSEKKKRRISSVILTLIIIALLIFSGPVRAVIVSITQDKTTYNSGDENIVFTVDVDVETDERIPVQNLTLKVTGVTNKTCIFYPSGSAISGCGNMSITAVNVVGYGNDTLWGYGYGYYNGTGYGTYNFTNVGIGYGYGYSSGYTYNGSTGGELRYNITWNITAEGAGDGSYTANLEAFVEKGSTYMIFMDQTPTSFTVDKTAPTITISSVGGDTSSPYAITDSTPTIELTTNENATCRYSSSDVSYGSMTDFSTTGTSSHSTTLVQLFSGTYTYYIKCKDSALNEVSTSVDFTLTVSSAGTGDGTTTVSEPKQISTFESIKSGETVTVTIAKADEIGVTEISITVGNDVEDVRVTVQKLAEKPEEVIQEVLGTVYRYLKITAENLDNEDIETATIQFKVEKAWLEENGFDSETILLNRYYDDEWEALSTGLTSEDDEYYYYEASLAGFSIFSITAGAIEEVAVCGDGVYEQGETYESCPQDCPKPPEIMCGNDKCESGENCGNCPEDCPCAQGYECKDNVCVKEKMPKKISKKWFIIPILILMSIAIIIWIVKLPEKTIRKNPQYVF